MCLARVSMQNFAFADYSTTKNLRAKVSDSKIGFLGVVIAAILASAAKVCFFDETTIGFHPVFSDI